MRCGVALEFANWMPRALVQRCGRHSPGPEVSRRAALVSRPIGTDGVRVWGWHGGDDLRRGSRRRTCDLMPPQRSVIPDAELREHARSEPIRVPLAAHGKLNDFLADKLSHLIVRGHGEVERTAHSLEGPVHGLNVLGLESEVVRRGSWHLGAADYGAAPAIPHTTARSAQKCDRHEELKWGTARVPFERPHRSDTVCYKVNAVFSPPNVGTDMSTYRIERDRGIKEYRQQLAELRQKWPLAFPVHDEDVRPLAVDAAHEIAAVMDWSYPYTLGVLSRWKMAPLYCQAVLRHDQRIALDGSPAEMVETPGRERWYWSACSTSIRRWSHRTARPRSC